VITLDLPGTADPVVFVALGAGAATTRCINVMGVAPESPAAAFATSIMQLLRSDEVVPHVPVPTVPVTTLNVVAGSVPSALTVIGVAVARSQPAEEVAVARHSRAKTESAGVKSAPVTLTDAPLVRPVEGETWMFGGVAPAMVVVVVGGTVVVVVVVVPAMVVVVVVVPPPEAKVIGAEAKTVEVATVATEIWHVASVAEVPHVPLPTVPAATSKKNDTSPLAFEVTST
jgi:hypothetical protein